MTPYKGFHLDPEFEAMPKITVADAHALIDEYRRDQKANSVNRETLERAGWHEKRNVRPPLRLTWDHTVVEMLQQYGIDPTYYYAEVYHDTPNAHIDGRAQPVITVCVLHEIAGTRSYCGVARCAAGDQFSRRKGRELALARATAKIKT